MSVEFSRNFGKRLRYLRRIRDMTQEQLAELTGLTANYVSLLETGSRTPSFEVLEKIAKALDVEASELLVFDKNPPKRSRRSGDD